MKTKIICTLGPSSFPSKILNKLKNQKIDIFRINLSHTKKLNIEKTIKYLLKQKIKNICIDTEGAQIRTTSTKKKYLLKKNTKIKVFNDQKLSSGTSIHLYPKFNIFKLKLFAISNELSFEFPSIRKVEKVLFIFAILFFKVSKFCPSFLFKIQITVSLFFIKNIFLIYY